MHHRPSGPPVSARVGAAVARLRWHLRLWAGRRTRRLPLLLTATAAVTAVLLAAPVVTGADWQSMTVDSSSWQTSPATPTSTSSSPSSGESSTAWPAPRSTSAPAASSTPEQPAAATSGPPSPTPPEQTTAPSTTGPAPAVESTPAAAEDPADLGRSGSSGAELADPEPEPAPSPTATAAGPPAATPAPATPEVLGTEAQVLALVNQHRAGAGCAALVGDEGLAAVARAHSADMRDQNYFAHRNPAGDDPFARASKAGTTARAENIARGQRDAAAVVDSWMNSAGHRANILDCSLQRLGVGMAAGAGGTWWTQLFN